MVYIRIKFIGETAFDLTVFINPTASATNIGIPLNHFRSDNLPMIQYEKIASLPGLKVIWE